MTSCPYIWVDQAFALMRGWIQGFPKKLGSVWLTRTFGLECRADPGLAPGATFAGTLAASDRRLAQGSVTLEQLSERGPTHNDPGWSTCATSRGSPPATTARRPCTSWSAASRAIARSRRSGKGSATLELFDAPGEEHAALAPVRVGRGFRFSFAYTVDDLETLRDLL